MNTRVRTLMKVEPYHEFGAFEYPLTEEEVELIRTASHEEWHQARRALEVERRVIEYEFGLLEDLLGVIARHPQVPVPVALTITSEPEPDADAEALLSLPAGEFRAAWRALYQLGWVRRA
jgi:hypothetical protein